ncbi:MAG: molybdenum cofactor guanylyltransferase [Pirellulaceae bacterium]|nr:molybdenum cofactor guanylyltransferase [Pirellulaceae bacterium]
MSGAPPVIGIVLCGGRSSRMGQDKNLVTWGGQTFLQQVVTALEQVCSALVLIKSDLDQVLPDLDVKVPTHVLVDDVRHDGPASSVRVGLEYVRDLWVQNTAACSDLNASGKSESAPLVLLTGNDSPLLQSALLRFLLDRLRSDETFDAVVPCRSPSPHDCFPLCAAYRLKSLEELLTYLGEGGRSLKGWLSGLRVDWVSEASLRVYDPDLRSLINLNSPQDLEEARAKLG